jgi:hypothetical protein
MSPHHVMKYRREARFLTVILIIAFSSVFAAFTQQSSHSTEQPLLNTTDLEPLSHAGEEAKSTPWTNVDHLARVQPEGIPSVGYLLGGPVGDVSGRKISMCECRFW